MGSVYKNAKLTLTIIIPTFLNEDVTHNINDLKTTIVKKKNKKDILAKCGIGCFRPNLISDYFADAHLKKCLPIIDNDILCCHKMLPEAEIN